MAKTTIIGTLTEVDQIETKENYSSQQARILVQEFDSETGKARDPQVFPVTFFNKKIKECGPSAMVNKKVRCTAFLKSVTKSTDKGTFYNVLLNGASLEEA